jgi:hypothetical protein
MLEAFKNAENGVRKGEVSQRRVHTPGSETMGEGRPSMKRRGGGGFGDRYVVVHCTNFSSPLVCLCVCVCAF